MTTLQVRDVENPAILWTFDLHNNTRTMTDPASGRLITMDLGVADVHIDSALANYAAGYQSADKGMIADEVIPLLPVEKNSNKFYTWDKNDVFQEVTSLEVAPGGAMAEISPRLSIGNYNCVSYGVQSFVATEVQANADSALNPERQAVVRCMTAIRLARERRAANMLMAAGSWTGGTVTPIAAGNKWNGGATADPVRDLYTAMEASLVDVTGIVMSERTFHDFVQNPNVQKYIASKTAIAPVPGSSDFASILQLPPFIVGKRKALATSSTVGYLWGDNVALIHADAGIPSGGSTISTARTFRWNGANGGANDGTMQGGFLVRSYFDPKRGPRGGKVVAIVHNDTEVMTSAVAGALLTGVHQ
jgi:hypothetical protein